MEKRNLKSVWDGEIMFSVAERVGQDIHYSTRVPHKYPAEDWIAKHKDGITVMPLATLHHNFRYQQEAEYDGAFFVFQPEAFLLKVWAKIQ
ncbi:MAG: hypothetical protein ACRENG_10935 [bacterium]